MTVDDCNSGIRVFTCAILGRMHTHSVGADYSHSGLKSKAMSLPRGSLGKRLTQPRTGLANMQFVPRAAENISWPGELQSLGDIGEEEEAAVL